MATGMIDTCTEQLLTEVRDGVARITLNRPEARNALGNTITPALRRQVRDRGADPDVRALLVTGADDALCAAGASLGGDVKCNNSKIQYINHWRIILVADAHRHSLATKKLSPIKRSLLQRLALQSHWPVWPQTCFTIAKLKLASPKLMVRPNC